MKLLLTLLLVFSSIFSSAETNRDSLLNILLEESEDITLRLDTISTFQQTELNSDDKFSYKKKLEEVKLNFEKGIKDSKNRLSNLFFVFLGILFLIIFAFWNYIRKKEKQNFLEKQNLLQQIESLKKKLSAHSVSTSVGGQKMLTLDKEKIEKAINNKLGESSWIILNLIFVNPSISNKEIAKEAFLSLEGVSSSLRRMYQAFGITTTSNKKITLIMKATRLSFEN